MGKEPRDPRPAIDKLSIVFAVPPISTRVEIEHWISLYTSGDGSVPLRHRCLEELQRQGYYLETPDDAAPDTFPGRHALDNIFCSNFSKHNEEAVAEVGNMSEKRMTSADSKDKSTVPISLLRQFLGDPNIKALDRPQLVSRILEGQEGGAPGRCGATPAWPLVMDSRRYAMKSQSGRSGAGAASTSQWGNTISGPDLDSEMVSPTSLRGPVTTRSRHTHSGGSHGKNDGGEQQQQLDSQLRGGAAPNQIKQERGGTPDVFDFGAPADRNITPGAQARSNSRHEADKDLALVKNAASELARKLRELELLVDRIDLTIEATPQPEPTRCEVWIRTGLEMSLYGDDQVDKIADAVSPFIKASGSGR